MLSSVWAISRSALALKRAAPKRAAALTLVPRYRFASLRYINLATVTYLFEGVLLHSDSLKVVQEIHPGAVNWMTAGRGIVHSERSPNAGGSRERRLHGIQTWLALPEEHEETEPWFRHYSATDIPTLHLPPLDFIDSETLHVIIDTPNCKTIPSARRLKREKLCIVRYSYLAVLGERVKETIAPDHRCGFCTARRARAHPTKFQTFVSSHSSTGFSNKSSLA